MSLSYDVTNTSTAIASIERTGLSMEPVSLTIYVHEGDINGAMLAGVQVSGQDAAGNDFEGTTDTSGAASINGVPGSWQFMLSKEGYDSAIVGYDVNQTEDVVAYLQRTNQSQNLITLTIHVHDSDLNGTPLADVQVSGQDFAGNSFEGLTDSSGVLATDGVPGTWQFTFSKEGYETLNLSYNATETEDTGAYLMRATDSQENLAPSQSIQ